MAEPARLVWSIPSVQSVVARAFGLPVTALSSASRSKGITFARHVAMYLCHARVRCSFPELGRAFGGRDHTTVMAAVRRIEALRGTTRAPNRTSARSSGSTSDHEHLSNRSRAGQGSPSSAVVAHRMGVGKRRIFAP